MITYEASLDGDVAAIELLYDLRKKLLGEERANWEAGACAAFQMLAQAAAYLVDTRIIPFEVSA